MGWLRIGDHKLVNMDKVHLVELQRSGDSWNACGHTMKKEQFNFFEGLSQEQGEIFIKLLFEKLGGLND
jgi:hypothetical protein